MRPDVERWLRRRTSRSADWDPDHLLAAKGATRVSVVLPALDEESTIGALVAEVHGALVSDGGGNGLVDELVVVDSGSADATARVAAAAGARVVRREDVLPHIPAVPGKGEAMWRSLACTSGDVVVFLDADLEEFSAAYVTGLLGPLLTDPSVVLVKAVYDRPLRTDGQHVPAGGGRVTELVARPLLALHWPELSGVVQPLAGEYAARRRLLERVRFPTGYGVELALLVDTLALAGLDAIAQVDLGVRLHRHHDDQRLGLMASEIMQVALDRLQQQGRLRLRDRVNPTLSQFAPAAGEGDERGGRLVTTHDVGLVQRPPMAGVPGYLPTTRGDRAS